MKNKLLIALLILGLPFLVFADSETTIGGQRGAGHIIEDEGVKLRQDSVLNFTGAGVTATTSNGKTVVTIGGGAGGTLNDLTDVNTSGVVTSDTLVYNGSSWGVGAGGSTNLTTSTTTDLTGFIKGNGSVLSADNSTYHVSGSPIEVTVANAGNTIGLDITQNDVTNNNIGALITNTGTGNALKIDQNGAASSSVSVGGAMLLENTGNTGAGLIVYSDLGATASGRLVNIKADNAAFDQAALHIDYDGVANAVEIVANSVQDDAVPLTITNTNWTASSIGLGSDVENHGIIKAIHSFPSAGVGASGNDSVASVLSMDFQGVGTACQGIFMTSTETGGGTAGKLLNLRNRVQAIGDTETELFTLTGAGFVGISTPTPAAVLDIDYADKTDITEESILFRSKGQTLTLRDGATIAAFRQNQFLAPILNGVAGGGTETVTTAATVYIDNKPTTTGATLTAAYSLYVDAGDAKFDDQIIASTFRSTSGGIVNNASANNARLQLNAAGSVIDKNTSDANPCLIVKQIHASSTGDIVQFQNNATTVANITQAGVFSIGGVAVPTISSTSTFTNKRITKRLVTATDDASAEINVDITDTYELSAVANATTFTLAGTPTDGQMLMIRFKDAGGAKGLTWTGFTAIGVTLPTTTVAGKWHYVGCVYNLAATQWQAIAVGVQA